jgi:hypothetical protein
MKVGTSLMLRRSVFAILAHGASYVPADWMAAPSPATFGKDGGKLSCCAA